MSPTVATGVYLEDNPPRRSQFRIGRRDTVKPVIVVHTAEGVGAHNVATFIRRRGNAGSYHLVGDLDEIVQLVRFDNEAFGDATGSNRWAIHISGAMFADHWEDMGAAERDGWIDTYVAMAVIAAHWFKEAGVGLPMPAFLNRAESNRRAASGFTSHRARDPERRTDPGLGFPWDAFLRRYAEAINLDLKVETMTHLEQYQQALLDAGYPIRLDPPLDEPDDDFGPTMLATSLLILEALKADPLNPAGPSLITKALRWDRYAAATTDLDALNELAIAEAWKTE